MVNSVTVSPTSFVVYLYSFLSTLCLSVLSVSFQMACIHCHLFCVGHYLLSASVFKSFKSLPIFCQHAQWFRWFGRTGCHPGLCGIPLWELSEFHGPQRDALSRSQKVRHLTSLGSLRHDFISCCLWVVTLELTEGEPYLMNTGAPKKADKFHEVNFVI